MQATGSGTLHGSRVLVTGGSGFIGSHLVEALVEQGATVGMLARSHGKLVETRATSRCEFLKCDITDADRTIAVVKAFAPSVIYHLAAHADAAESHAQATSAIAVNALGTLNLLEGASVAGTELFVYGDSTKVYGSAPVPFDSETCVNPACSYAIGKAAGWDLCRLYRRTAGLKCVSIRPTLTYGPRQARNLFSFVMEVVARGERKIVLEGGSQTRDPVYVEDAVEAYLSVPASSDAADGRVINIGGGREYTIIELAEASGLAAGHAIQVIGDPSRIRPTEIMQMFCDNSEAQDLLGWSPRTELSEGLRRTAAYMFGSDGEFRLKTGQEGGK